MNSTFLICAYPRSRSMWLSRFLTVPGHSICTHEALEYAGSADEFWRNAELYAYDSDIYGNSDSANIFVLPALLASRPLTRVVWINRPIVEVAVSMKNAGMPVEEKALRNLVTLRERYRDYFDVVIDFHALPSPAICGALWEFCLEGIPFDFERWEKFNAMKIGYSKENPMPPKYFQKFLGWVQQELGEMERNKAA